MEKKINIAELLKDCPSGMELNCISYDNVSFDKISADKKAIYPIFCYITDEKGNRSGISFTEDGCESKRYGAKCVIFPKGKNTWEGFQRPFKDGDIVADEQGNIAIYKQIHKFFNEPYVDFYCGLAHCNELFVIKNNKYQNWGKIKYIGFATEEEKEKLFQAIKDNGYQWNAETKTLEKFIKPVFKIGDKISLKCEDLYWDIETIEGDWYICTNGAKIHIEEQHHYELVLVEPKFKVGDIITNGKTFIAIGYIDDEYYYEINRDIAHRLCIKNQDEWELVPNKFDINTLKTFDQVLVRLTNNCVWMPKLFSHYDPKVKCYPFVTLDNMGYPQCIPYKGNEHLCRTTDDCNKFYKTWK